MSFPIENRPTSRLYTPSTVIPVLLFLAALVIRATTILRLHSIQLYGDMVHYDASGEGIITRHLFSFWGGAPDAYVTPGYPLFLALCYKIGSWVAHSHAGEIHFALLVQALLSSVTTLFIYFISRRFLSLRFASVPALIWVVYPPAIWSDALVLTESLFVFFLFLYLWLVHVAWDRGHFAWWLLTGFTLGLAGLVRPTVFPLAVVSIVGWLWQWWRHSKFANNTMFSMTDGESRFGVTITGALLYIAGFIVAMLPWWIRNYRVLHQLVLSDTEIGNPLLYGTDPNFQNDPNLSHGLNQAQQKALAIHRIVTWLHHQPLSMIHWYTIGKLHYLFGTAWYHTTSHKAILGMVNLSHVILVILGAIGLILGLAVRQMRFISLVGLFLIIVQLPFIPINRYAFPVMPMLFMGVGLLVQSVIRSLKRRGVAL